MKLLLRRDVKDLGEVGDVVDVADGYARNFLLPRDLAMVATPENEKRIQADKRRTAEKEAKRLEGISEKSEFLEGKSVTVQARATEDQTLYGSVGPAEIVEAILTEHNQKIAEADVAIEEHFKQLGVFEVPLKFGTETECTIKLWIVEQ